jgi:hypothetical protein
MNRRHRNILLLLRTGLLRLALIALAFHLSTAAEELFSDSALQDYKHLLEWRFSKNPIRVPDGGISWSRDCATWTLESGRIWLMEPTSHGICTGMIFEGKGHFQMKISDPIEVEQLKRFSKKEVTSKIDEYFTTLVVRTPEKFISELFSLPDHRDYVPNPLAKNRHEEWLELAKMDIDARVLSGLLNPGDEFLCVDMKMDRFGWLMYIFDTLVPEEIQLRKHRSKRHFVEIWVSLDRESDRKETARPTGLRRDPIDITHLDVEVDLSEWKYIPYFEGEGPRVREKAIFKAVVYFTSLVEGHRAVQLNLHPRAKVIGISTMDGTSLPFIRDPIGKRFLSVRSELYDSLLVVLFDKFLMKNETKEIKVTYEMDISNYVSGRSWYPTIINNIYDLNTVNLKVMLDQKYNVMAVGDLKKESVADEIKTSQWKLDIPTRIYGFTVGEKFDEEKMKVEGLPEVISFGIDRALTPGDAVKNVAVDVSKSLKFYQQFFDIDFPMDRIHATYIDSGHGQAFHGFLHLPKYIFFGEFPGVSELVRAHEVAHQLWGQLVRWKTYRDQWLSEAFAEYSAMLFLESTLPEEKYFEEILEVYNNELTGSIKAGFSRFARPVNIKQVMKHRKYLGPISVGFRASTVNVPDGYIIQIYDKGAYVLHMLRVLLRNATGDENLFRTILKDFLHTYKGKEASTEDFKHIIEKHTQEDWTWFFDQWIHSTVIPTYSWSYDVTRHPDEKDLYELFVKVKQSDVPPDFKMTVPLLIKHRDGTTKYLSLLIDESEKSFKFEMQKKPKKVIFNPDYSVLSKVKKM